MRYLREYHKPNSRGRVDYLGSHPRWPCPVVCCRLALGLSGMGHESAEGSRGVRGSGNRRGCRQRKRESRTLLYFAFATDLSAVFSYDALYGGQSNPGPFEVFRAVEPQENAETANSRHRVYLTAFDNRFVNTCLIKPGSHSTTGKFPRRHSICRPSPRAPWRPSSPRCYRAVPGSGV